jgi:hypothetical protein
VLLERREDPLAVRLVRLVASGAERRGGRLGDPAEQLVGGGLEVDEVLVDDPPHAVAAAEELVDEAGAGLLRLLDDADEGLVDDGRRPAGLADDGVAFEGGGHGCQWLVVSGQ